ncbi:MAG: Ger(x)C family spore germination protein [Bacillota bacterium]
MVKKILILCLILICLMLNLGCWNKVELNERAFVMGVGVDKGENDTVKLTVQILLPEKVGVPSAGAVGSDSEKPVWVVTSTGHTIFDAVRNFVMQSGRKLFWQYNKIIIIGEEAAWEGILPILDFFARDHEIRLDNKVLVARGKALDILNTDHELEPMSAVSIKDMVEGKKAIGTIVDVTLFDIMGRLTSKSMASIASRIELLGSEAEDEKKLRVTGAAVFREDKLAGFLNKPETRGLNWVLGEVVSGIIVVISPLNPQENASIEIIRAGSKVKPEFKDGYFLITVEVNMEGNLGEQQSRVNLVEPERWASLERRAAEVIENEIKAALEKAQKEYKTDIFGFGEAIYRKFPSQWKQIENVWEDLFEQLEIDLKINVKLRRTGIITTPVRSE